MNEELKQKLIGLKLTSEQVEKLVQAGAESEDDISALSAEQLDHITGCGLITAMKVLKSLVKAEPTPVATATPVSSPSMDILPTVPDDTSFLEMLKVGGVLNIQPVDVIAAMRAALASKVRLYELPDVILRQMEQFADEQEVPVGESFYALQKLIAQRNYGDILAALGTNGHYVNETRKKALLQRLNEGLWPALNDFHKQLVAWSESWTTGMANPGVALAALAMATTGSGGAILPPGMMQPPETSGLRDEAEAVINRINRVFAGTGIPVARALGYDATQIRAILEKPELPAAVGATTRDAMLKMLKVNVGPDYIRLERNVTRYALGIMEFPKVGGGNAELSYLSALLMLGTQIPWDKLTTSATLEEPPRRTGRDVRRNDY